MGDVPPLHKGWDFPSPLLYGGVEDKDDEDAENSTAQHSTAQHNTGRAEEGDTSGGVEEGNGFDPENLPHNQRRGTREGDAGSNEPIFERSRQSRLFSISRRVSSASIFNGSWIESVTFYARNH